ncbi:transcription factor 20-like [Pollicipes pollicipes]|uniref:transcription factor 20-like n=1 Tax=Pollicipes pollicipes TaxID=41117 RepID=UPI001884CB3E|nr:transcription factor 20-like [Pollicipes pollicipes]
MKEPFGVSPTKTRGRLRSVTEEEPAGPARRTSRERPVNGGAALGPAAASAAAAAVDEGDAMLTSSPPPLDIPDGVSHADGEAKWRCWNDDGAKKSWQAAGGEGPPPPPPPPPPAPVSPLPSADVPAPSASGPAPRDHRRRRRHCPARVGGADPHALRVVNSQGDLEAPAARRRPPVSCDLEAIPGQPRVGFSSAYAKNYDAFAPDPTWTCVFCGRRTHASRLGDLYGPYFVRRRQEAAGTTAKQRQRRRSQREAPEAADPAAAAGSGAGPSAGAAHHFETARLGDRLETWFHESCLAWSPQLQLAAGRVQGVEEAVTASRAEICSVCRHVGATVGCLGKGCRLGFHVPCAEEAGCQLDESSFTSYCSKHKKPD